MQPHQQPPTTLDAIAADIARSAHAAVTAADHRDHDDDGLDAAAVLLAAIDRLTAAVITVLQTADHHRVIADHGLTRDTWLRAVAGRTGADAGMLLAAAERLADMPAVTAWFHRGVLSWGAVRAIVAATRNLTVAQRAWVDAALADHDGVDRLDGDQIAAAVDGLAVRARPDLHRDRDTNAVRRRWLSIQPRLDGTTDIVGTLDPDRRRRARRLRHHPHTRPPPRPRRRRRDVGWRPGPRREAAGERRHFGDLCRQRLTRHHTADATDSHTADPAADDAVGPHAAGASAAGRSCSRCGSAPSTARPAFLVVADLAALDPDAPVGSGTARLHWATTHAPPVELTAAAAQRLACDATLRVVVTDGAEVLGVTAAHPKVSATLRAALLVRDGGCRFSGCTQPADRCDTHHIIPVAANGATTLPNLHWSAGIITRRSTTAAGTPPSTRMRP